MPRTECPQHHVTVVLDRMMPGMVRFLFSEPQPKIVTPGGNSARLACGGCALGEVASQLGEIEQQHGVRLIVRNPRGLA